jgi:hypothetical protein
VLLLGQLACLLFAGCRPHIPDDRCPGAVGYVSDRAHEEHVTIEGAVEPAAFSLCSHDVRACGVDWTVRSAVSRRVQTAAQLSEARGRPFFPGRATRQTRFAFEPAVANEPPRVRFTVELVSFARDDEHPDRTWPWEDGDGIRFADPAAKALSDTLPRFVSADGITRVALVFGQLGKKDLWPDDPGFWSAAEAERSLVERGFVHDGDHLARGSIEVRIVRPTEARLRSREATRAVRDALARNDVVYVNGHARSRLFAGLPPPEAGSGRPKLVFVDTCWSYALETNPLRAAYPEATLVITDGRVTTGSVAVVPALLDAATERPRVGAWLERINDAAARRAVRRRENPDLEPVLQAAEVYGVVPAMR